MTERPLVLALGNPLRGDDGIGAAVAAALRSRPDAARVDVVDTDGEPARLISWWADREHVVVVDAMRSGVAPGTVRVLDLLRDEAPTRPSASSHGAGLADALALARQLDRLPGSLVLVGVEGAHFDLGAEMSAPVTAAICVATDRALTELEGA